LVPEDTPLRILEIGLGCGMPQEWGGTGNSLKLWRALFPRAAVSFIEYHANCAKEFQADIEATGGRLFTGSQADPKVLGAVVGWASRIGGFDLIIDDGGHDPVHQRQSLEGLFGPALRPGGVYVVEDLLTSYWERYNTTGWAEGAFIPFIKDAIDAMNCHGAMPELTASRWQEHCKQPLLGKQFLAVGCGVKICAVLKHRTPPPAGYIL
jgi:hypothetical protein